MSPFDRLLRDEIRVVKSDGTRGPAIKASVSRKTISVLRSDISIEEGDMIERDTSRGVTERYFVKEVEFQEQFHQIPAHYTLHVEKQTKLDQETKNQKPHTSQSHVHVQGNQNRVLVQSTDDSINIVQANSVVNAFDALQREVENEIEDDQELADAIDILKIVRKAVEQYNARPSVVEKLLNNLPGVGKIVSLANAVVTALAESE